MTFAHPWLLVLLLVPLIAGAWKWLRGGRTVFVPFDHLQVANRKWIDRIIRTAGIAPYLLAAIAILMLAGPQRELTGESDRDVQNVNLLLDSSMSMSGDKHNRAMDAIEAFVSRRKGDAFALTLFGNDALNWIPLTRDLSPIRLSRPFIKPSSLPGDFGGTATGHALSLVCEQLKRSPKGDRFIILITDGSAGDLGMTQAQAIAQRLADAHIVVYTVLINDGATPPEAVLISEQTGGVVFQSADPNTVPSIFEKIDRMTPARMRPVARSRIDWFEPVALSGIVLLGFHSLMLFGVRFNPW